MDVLPEKGHKEHEADKPRDRLLKDVSCPLIFTIFQSFRIRRIYASSKL